MDRKDEIILQQMDLIRSMTERNLRSMDADFWGTPLMEKKVTEKAEKPAEKLAAASGPHAVAAGRFSWRRRNGERRGSRRACSAGRWGCR